MRRFVAVSLSAALVLAPPWAPLPRPAAAVTFFCANCSTWTQQLMEYGKQVEQVAETITMRINQAQMLQNQIQNMASLPGQVWQQIEGNFTQTQALFRQGTQLMNSASMVSGQLQSYRSLLGTTVNMPAQYARWSQQANDNVTATLRGLGLMRDQMPSDRAIITQIRARSAGATGAVQAIQANTEMASAQVNELHRLREIMMEDARMNANALAMQAERQAMEDAARDDFFRVPMQAERGNRRW